MTGVVDKPEPVGTADAIVFQFMTTKALRIPRIGSFSACAATRGPVDWK